MLSSLNLLGLVFSTYVKWRYYIESIVWFPVSELIVVPENSSGQNHLPTFTNLPFVRTLNIDAV